MGLEYKLSRGRDEYAAFKNISRVISHVILCILCFMRHLTPSGFRHVEKGRHHFTVVV